MPHPAHVTIHPSQFPGPVRRELIESFRRRRVNPKFHYDSVKQTRQWLALHQVFSPSRTDPDCAAAYDRSFAEAARRIGRRRVHVIGLGCGGGQKDTRLIELLKHRGAEVFYTPCDVSVAMVLEARRTALRAIPESRCFPLVCDLVLARDLPAVLARNAPPGAARLVTFFGMIPNFEPPVILPKFASLIAPEDQLLFSANLAPGRDYARGMNAILPQYDNALTREWLMTFLLDLGVERGDGEIRFGIETVPGPARLKRVTADFHFSRPRRVHVDARRFRFRAGESIRLFFSYRYTPGRVRSLLRARGLRVTAQWVTPSGQEGVFLCRRSAPVHGRVGGDL
jgi:uncharacterized SAM-dependent methyltransferase